MKRPLPGKRLKILPQTALWNWWKKELLVFLPHKTTLSGLGLECPEQDNWAFAVLAVHQILRCCSITQSRWHQTNANLLNSLQPLIFRYNSHPCSASPIAASRESNILLAKLLRRRMFYICSIGFSVGEYVGKTTATRLGEFRVFYLCGMRHHQY